MAYIYLLEKRYTVEWILCVGPNLFAGFTKAEADNTAKRFAEGSVGVQFRAKRYKRA